MTISRCSPGAANWRRTSPYRTAMSRASLVADAADPPTLTRPADQRPQHGEEAAGLVLDQAGVGAVLGHLAVAVEQHVPGDLHVVEGQPSVVDAEQAGLGAVVTDRDTRHRVALLVAD